MISGLVKRFGLWIGLVVGVVSLAAIGSKIHIMETNISNLVISDTVQNQMILTIGLQDCPIEAALATNYERLTEYIINHCNGGEIWSVKK